MRYRKAIYKNCPQSGTVKLEVKKAYFSPMPRFYRIKADNSWEITPVYEVAYMVRWLWFFLALKFYA